MEYAEFLRNKTVRKSSEGFEPAPLNPSLFPWQRYASPVWFDIPRTDVLNARAAKDSKDEKHICPLQLEVIRRAVQLWSNPGEVVFSPFGGIGSEPYVAVEQGRKAVAIELKPEYFDQMVKNVADAAGAAAQGQLF